MSCVVFFISDEKIYFIELIILFISIFFFTFQVEPKSTANTPKHNNTHAGYAIVLSSILTLTERNHFSF